jgi:hypothetical protein
LELMMDLLGVYSMKHVRFILQEHLAYYKSCVEFKKIHKFSSLYNGDLLW